MTRTVTSAYSKWQAAIVTQLKNEDALQILDISVGHIFDMLNDEIEDEYYTDTVRGHVVEIEATAEPDGVCIKVNPSCFNLNDSLRKPLSSYGYFDDQLLDKHASVTAMAAILDTLYMMMASCDTHPSDLDDQWDG